MKTVGEWIKPAGVVFLSIDMSQAATETIAFDGVLIYVIGCS